MRKARSRQREGYRPAARRGHRGGAAWRRAGGRGGDDKLEAAARASRLELELGISRPPPVQIRMDLAGSEELGPVSPSLATPRQWLSKAAARAARMLESALGERSATTRRPGFESRGARQHGSGSGVAEPLPAAEQAWQQAPVTGPLLCFGARRRPPQGVEIALPGGGDGGVRAERTYCNCGGGGSKL